MLVATAKFVLARIEGSALNMRLYICADLMAEGAVTDRGKVMENGHIYFPRSFERDLPELLADGIHRICVSSKNISSS